MPTKNEVNANQLLAVSTRSSINCSIGPIRPNFVNKRNNTGGEGKYPSSDYVQS